MKLKNKKVISIIQLKLTILIKKKGQFANLSEEQIEWENIKSQIFKTKPKPLVIIFYNAIFFFNMKM